MRAFFFFFVKHLLLIACISFVDLTCEVEFNIFYDLITTFMKRTEKYNEKFRTKRIDIGVKTFSTIAGG